VIFFIPSRQILGWYLDWANNASLKFFIIHLSFYHPALYSLDTESVIK
jgi:hypothetical protein